MTSYRMNKSELGRIKPTYLLPKGCKDLIDVIRRQPRQPAPQPPPPEIYAWVFLPETVTVRYLAMITEEDVHSIAMHMGRLGIPFSMVRGVQFAGAERLLLFYGIQAEPRET